MAEGFKTKAELLGALELQKTLRLLPEKLAKAALASTSRAGAQVLRSTALAHLSVNMSRTAREDDVVIKKVRGKKGEDVQVVHAVGPPRRKPWLRWLHDGTKPHDIEVQTAPELFSRKLNAWLGRVVHHPGQIPRPWLFSAWHAAQGDVYVVMAYQMKRALAKQAKKLASVKFSRKLARGIFK